jgi:hypothetical protein
MKSLVLVAILFSAQVSLACMPPPKKWMQQKWELDQLLESQELNDKLEETGADRITNIELSGGTYTISTGTPCQIVAKTKYGSATSNGSCPRFDGFELVATCSPQD